MDQGSPRTPGGACRLRTCTAEPAIKRAALVRHAFAARVIAATTSSRARTVALGDGRNWLIERVPTAGYHRQLAAKSMTDEDTRYLGYIRELAYRLRERTMEAVREQEETGAEFEDGRAFGLRQALAWMQHHADSFDIPREEVCLAGFDAMTDPVDPPPLTRKARGS